MNSWILGLGLLVLMPALAAQDPAAVQVETTESRWNSLVAEYSRAAAEHQTKSDALYDSEEYLALKKARDTRGLRKLRSTLKTPAPGFVPRFLALARSCEGSQIEAECLVWILLHARAERGTIQHAVQGILDRHIDRDAAQVLALNWFRWRVAYDAPGMRKVLNSIIEKSKNDEAVAEALFSRCRTKGKDPRRSPEHEDVLAILKRAPRSTAALRLRGERFAKERLQIGMKAPDITGKDTDGNEFKLSDYAGKVIVLDFWGDW